MNRVARLVAAPAAAAAVGGYALAAGGEPGPGTVMLALGGAALVEVGFTLYRAIEALIAEAPPEVERAQGGRRRRELEREKQLLLKAIKEVEFDHEMGKVADVDFHDIVGRYRARAMRILKQLEEGAGEYRALAEAELKARGTARAAAGATRGGGGAAAPATDGLGAPAAPTSDGVGASEAPGSAGAGAKRAARSCACGAANDADAAFCKRCGGKLRPRCASCATDNDPDAAFCKRCGGRLGAELSA